MSECRKTLFRAATDAALYTCKALDSCVWLICDAEQPLTDAMLASKLVHNHVKLYTKLDGLLYKIIEILLSLVQCVEL